MKKKILFISHSSDFGGTEFVFLKILSSFDKENVVLILPEKKNTLYTLLEKEYKIRIAKNFWICNTNIIKLIFKFFLNIISASKNIFFVYNNKIDTIYSSSSVTIIGILLAIITKKNHIWHIHENLTRSNYERIIYRYLFRYKKNKLIFVSQILKKEWEDQLKLKFENYEIVNNPIKKIKSEKKISKNFVYGFAGALDEHKNVLELIRAFESIEKEYTNLELNIAGNGILYDYIVKNNNSDNIKVLGKIEDMNCFYNSIDVLVVPSKGESFSLVAAEAMSIGIPVIINENVGIKSLISHLDNGLIYKSLDINDLRKNMKLIYENKELYFNISKKSITTIKSYFDEDTFNKKILEIFDIKDD